MNINLIPDFNEDDIQREIDAFLDKVFKVTRNEMIKIGWEFVREARLKVKAQGGFDDDTGNLRSSIGFILMYDGEIVHEDFEQSPRGTDKATGLATGRKMAEDLTTTEGWAIITVAGMEYASWVESKGYDVISGSTLGAEVKLKKAMENVLKEFR